MNADQARLAISLLDLTNLADDCTSADVDVLCDRALRYGTAAVCVWPDFVAQSARRVRGSGVRVATVVNFPSGSERPFAVGVVTEQALLDGADEIDVVLPYRDLASGHLERAAAMVQQVRDVTAGRALLKVILETGELPDVERIETAARLAIAHGADFIKTSTGKSAVSATLSAAGVMLDVIASAGRRVGIKPSGGISTAGDAQAYVDLAESVMGEGWVSPETFRFGASGVLDALLAELGTASASASSASTSNY